jgi:hypothetical protein
MLRGHGRRRRIACALAAVTLPTVVAAMVAPGTANAGPPTARTSGKPAASGAANSPWTRLMKEQEPLLAIANRVHGYVGAHPDAGYAGVSIDAASGAVDLYWHGALPAPITALVTRSAASGVPVAVHPAAYSSRALTQAQHALAASLSARGVPFASIAARLDGSGLDLVRPAAAQVAADVATTAAAAGVPVATSDGAQPRAADRFQDSPPYWGGDYMQAAPNAGPACSTGFAVASSTHVTSLLTASHCSPSGTGTWYTGSGTGQLTIGNVAGWDGSEDAMLIRTASQGAIWTGSALTTDTGQTAMEVNGQGSPTVGDMVCTSGAFSGQECGIKVVATGLVIQSCDENNHCSTYDDIAQGEQQNHTNAAGNGDSGGPVFTIINNGANANGTISSIDTTASATCTGVPAGNGRTCSWRVFFPDIDAQLGDFGVHLLTNGATS